MTPVPDDTDGADLFKALFDTAPDAIIVADHAGTIVLANPQADRLFGYAEGELQGKSVDTLLPESVRHAHAQHRARYMSAPRVRPMGAGHELIGVRRNGQSFPVEIGLSPIRTSKHTLFATSIRDISETQRARQALARARYDGFLAQASRPLLESPSLDVAIDGIAALVATALQVEAVLILLRDIHGTDLQVRAALGLPEPLLRRMIRRLSRGPWLTEALLAEGGEASAELARSSGHITSLLRGTDFRDAAVVPLPDRYGPMGLLVVPVHSTESIDHDMLHFLQLIANLLAAAVQRTRSDEQLSHAQRMDAIGQLTGGIAHDFNNMLTVISGNLQLLTASLPRASSQSEIVDNATRATDRCAALTGKLLSFASRRRLIPRPLRPAQVLNDLREMLTRTLGERVQVTTECATDMPFVSLDPAEFDTALLNLAVNARDAMPRGGQLTLSARVERIDGSQATQQTPAGTYVAFCVADTGMGMPPDVQARALEPFFTTKEAGKGSGLGLSMVYGFVKQSGGRLDIDSQPGEGTRVSLRFPALEDVPAMEGVTARVPVHRGRETILVVEDEPEVRGVAVAFLHSLGYLTREADSATGALAQLECHPDIDLIFSDVVLSSGMTGVELVKAARLSRPELPVLLTSGYARGSLDADDPSLGRVELLRKPYRVEQLSEALRNALTRR
jgi:PAS domain S-box-containing protein